MGDKLKPLYAERAAKVEQMRSLVEASETRGEVTADDKATIDGLTREIEDLDGRIERCQNGSGGSFGAMLSARSFEYGAGGASRDLGEWASEELRSVLVSGSGSAIVPPDALPRAWDRLAEKSVGLKSGFTVIPTDSSELRLPRVTSDVVANFVAEFETIAESDPGLDLILAQPKKLATITSTSMEAVLDSNPAAMNLLMSNIFRALGLGLDKAFFEGDPAVNADSIRGLKATPGIQSVANGSAALADLDPFVEGISLLEEFNAEATAIVMHPAAWAQLLMLREQTGSLKPLLSESAGSPTGGIKRSLLGIPVYLTSQLATDEGTGTDETSAYVYQADQVVAVRREEARIEVDRSVYFAKDGVAVRGVVRWDLAVPNVKAVCRISGIKLGA